MNEKPMPWGPASGTGPSLPPPALPPIAPMRVVFTGSRPSFRRLAIGGGLLELVTFGFYRFWLTTDIRRHLWANTAIGGDHAEYDGRAKELLIGFLIALAILLPFYLAYFLAGIEAERYQAFLSLPLILVLFLFAEFARYRGRRYRVSRTIWHGLRFGMGGSGWGYAWRAIGWSLLALVTLGLAWPWRQAALERYKMRHTVYGPLRGAFVGTGRGLLARVWWIVALGALSGAFLIPLPFLYAAFRAAEWRWWLEGLRVGNIRFQSDLQPYAFYGPYWKIVGWGTLLLVLVGAWSVGVFFFMMSTLDYQQVEDVREFLRVAQHPMTMIGIGLGYLLAVVVFGMALRLYLVHDIWERVAMSTTVHNLSAVEAVAGREELVGALGEGLSDGLDFGF